MRPLSSFVLLLSALLGAGPALGAGMSLSAPPGAGQPSGPAAGDLGGSYPSPTVTSVEHVATGTVAIANGGTGATSLSNHGVVVAGSSTLSTIAPGASGYVLTSNGTDWTSAASVAAVPTQRAFLNDGLIANTYQFAPPLTGTSSSTSPSTGNIRAYPIAFGRSGTVTKLGVVVGATVATSKIRVGLWEAGPDGYPTTLAGESGELDGSVATGTRVGSGLSISVSASKAYWIGYLGGTAAANVVTVTSMPIQPMVQSTSGSGTLTLVYGITVAQAYGALPSTFPASASAATSTVVPVMLVGVGP